MVTPPRVRKEKPVNLEKKGERGSNLPLRPLKLYGMSVRSDVSLFNSILSEGVSGTIESLGPHKCEVFSEQYGTHNYHPLPVLAVRASGSRVWDESGKEYIDCIGAYSAVSHGHLNPKIIQVIQEQLQSVALVSRAMNCPELGLFLKALCEYSGIDRACPMNSGAEAIETCIKLARKWGYEVKGIPDGQAEILVADGNFHGRTTTIVGFSSEPSYRRHFGPFSPGFKLVPFGDLDALRSAITPNTAAILMEPIQAEGGVILPPPGYLAQVRRVCNEHRVLLIWDEIQTGFARCGKRFAWQWEDAKPDLMSVGKALGGGIYPVSAAIGSEEVMTLFQPGDHGSTFGGNPLACAIGATAIAILAEEHLDERAQTLGAKLASGFRSIQSSKVKEVRGKGMLIGLEVEGDGAKLTDSFLKAGILTKETRRNTFRFAPPLTTDEQTIDEIIDRVGQVLMRA